MHWGTDATGCLGSARRLPGDARIGVAAPTCGCQANPWRDLARVFISRHCYSHFTPLGSNRVFTGEVSRHDLHSRNTKFCWICGKDVQLEHCTIDEHGLSVHKSCHEERMLLKAASLQAEQWRQAQPRRGAAETFTFRGLLGARGSGVAASPDRGPPSLMMASLHAI